jgi:hypothetical protein
MSETQVLSVIKSAVGIFSDLQTTTVPGRAIPETPRLDIDMTLPIAELLNLHDRLAVARPLTLTKTHSQMPETRLSLLRFPPHLRDVSDHQSSDHTSISGGTPKSPVLPTDAYMARGGAPILAAMQLTLRTAS